MIDGDEQSRARASERIAEVRDRFLAGFGERVEGLSGLARAAAGSDPAAASAAADSLRLGLHNLAGSAPTLGLTSVGRRAAALERRLIDERLGDGRLPQGAAADLAADISALVEEAA